MAQTEVFSHFLAGTKAEKAKKPGRRGKQAEEDEDAEKKKRSKPRFAAYGYLAVPDDSKTLEPADDPAADATLAHKAASRAEATPGLRPGAGAEVKEGRVVPPRSLVVGIPAKVVREVDERAVEAIRRSAQGYVEKFAQYLG